MKMLIIWSCAFAIILFMVAVNGDEVPGSVAAAEQSSTKLSSNLLRKPLHGAKLPPNANVRISAPPVIKDPSVPPKIMVPGMIAGGSIPKESYIHPVISSNALYSDGSFTFKLDGPHGAVHVAGILKIIDGKTQLQICGSYDVGSLQVNFVGNEVDGFKLTPIAPSVPFLIPKAIGTIVG